MGSGEVQPLNLVDLEELEPVGQSSGILDAEDEEEQGTKSFEDIYAYLLENEDIILTIDADDEETIRRGLSVVKHNHYKRLRKADTRVEEKQIRFNVIRRIEGTDPQQIQLQIWLSKRAAVKVHNIVVADKEL